MSRSPDSETVTPGRMALLLSVTAPTMDPVCTCAVAEVAASTTSAQNTNERKVLMPCPRCGGVRVVRRQYVATPVRSRPYTCRLMRKLGLAGVVFGFLGLCVSAGTPAQAPSGADAQSAVVKQYCATCHNDRTKSGGLSLAAFDVATAPEHADVAEK